MKVLDFLGFIVPKMRRSTPPIDPRPEEVILLREPYRKDIVLYVPNKESYKLDVEGLRTYFRLLGAKDPSYPVRVVWNFYCVWVSTITWRVEILSRERVKDYVGDTFDEKIRVYAPWIG